MRISRRCPLRSAGSRPSVSFSAVTTTIRPPTPDEQQTERPAGPIKYEVPSEISTLAICDDNNATRRQRGTKCLVYVRMPNASLLNDRWIVGAAFATHGGHEQGPSSDGRRSTREPSVSRGDA